MPNSGNTQKNKKNRRVQRDHGSAITNFFSPIQAPAGNVSQPLPSPAESIHSGQKSVPEAQGAEIGATLQISIAQPQVDEGQKNDGQPFGNTQLLSPAVDSIPELNTPVVENANLDPSLCEFIFYLRQWIFFSFSFLPSCLSDYLRCAGLVDDKVSLEEAVQRITAILGIQTQAQSFRELLFSRIRPSHFKDKLREFIDGIGTEITESIVPIDAFIGNENRVSWDTHCPKVTECWSKFVNKMKEIGEDSILLENLAAPSGPLHSRATFEWHFPTNTSKNIKFSHVMDTGSRTVSVQAVGYQEKRLSLTPINRLNSVKSASPATFERRTSFRSESHMKGVPIPATAPNGKTYSQKRGVKLERPAWI